MLETVGQHADGVFTAQRASVCLKVPQLPDLHLIDLRSFCRQLEAQRFDPDLSAAAGAVLSAVNPVTGGFVLKETHALVDDEWVGGVSVYLPPPGSGLASPAGYGDLRFAEEFKWDDFLRKYVREAPPS